jgi:hypothetical protein
MRKRQTETAQGLRQADDIGLDAGRLEAEERAGAAAADLDVVDDQQYVVSLENLGEFLEPLHAGDVDAAFGLHGFDE